MPWLEAYRRETAPDKCGPDWQRLHPKDKLVRMVFMEREHYVRTGPLGAIGRYVSVDPVSFPRGARVICRTSRGLEVGEVISRPVGLGPSSPNRGSIVRGMTDEDDFVWRRLTTHRDAAFSSCQRWLLERESNAILIDAEILFDARQIYFYFLGPTPAIDTEAISNLGAEYEAEIRFAEFADAVTHGCGPDCGTEQGGGCGDSCGGCAVADACKTARRGTAG